MVNIGRHEVVGQHYSTTITTGKSIFYTAGSADNSVHNIYVTDLLACSSAASIANFGIYPITAQGAQLPIEIQIGAAGTHIAKSWELPYHFAITASTGEPRYFAGSCSVIRAQKVSVSFYVEK